MDSRHLTLDEIAALFDGRLDARRKKAAEAHLRSGCERCRDEAEGIRAVLRALDRYELKMVWECPHPCKEELVCIICWFHRD